jgi:pseudaminic acid synthase
MKIKKTIISSKNSPFIIAELSANHDGKLYKALKIVDHAARCGVSAIKIQTINPEKITLNTKKKNFIIHNKKSIWYKKSFYELYKKASMPIKWQKKIFARAKKRGILAFSTPFDEQSVDLLEKMDVPCYKIASFENNHFPLLKKIAETKKPVIMSLGMLSLKEIYESVNYLKKHGTKEIALLKCTSVYPAKEEDLNLKSIQDLRKRFNCEVGFSDHTKDIYSSIAAVSLGATIIEKHFNLIENKKSLDSKFSITELEMKQLVVGCDMAQKSIGNIKYSLSKDEKISKKNKRSIYASKNIKKGEKFSEKNVSVVRPGYGLSPRFYFKIIGKKSTKNIFFADPIKKSYIC